MQRIQFPHQTKKLIHNACTVRFCLPHCHRTLGVFKLGPQRRQLLLTAADSGPGGMLGETGLICRALSSLVSQGGLSAREV